MLEEKKVVKLDVGTNLFTIEGRAFSKQLNMVSRVLSVSDAGVEFWREEKVKTGYVGDCKSIQLYECPEGFFLFCNKAFSNNNWSATGQTAADILDKIYDGEIKKKIEQTIAEAVTKPENV